ncbi:MAG: hypothetical protein Q8K06_08615, partial [Sulfuriferula sp.]
VLQSPAIAFNPGLHQPDAIREKLARGAATMRRKLMQLSDTENRGKVSRSHRCWGTALTPHKNGPGADCR